MKNGYVDYDDEQGIINKKIPSENIEILGNDGKWTTLNDYAHRYYRSFGISPDDISTSRGIGSTSTSRTQIIIKKNIKYGEKQQKSFIKQSIFLKKL